MRQTALVADAVVVGLLGGVVGAVATVSAQATSRWLARPRLGLLGGISPSGPPEAVVIVPPHEGDASSGGRETAFLRLKVENRGRVTAHDVSVLVVEIEALDGDDPAGNLATLPLKWGDLPDAALDLPPKIWRLVDIANTRRPQRENLLGIWPEHREDKRRVLLGERYRLTLAVTARDVPATFWSMVLVFPADSWSGRAVWEQFRIKDFKRLRAPRRPGDGPLR